MTSLLEGFEFSKGCPYGDACPQCDHCIASWHTQPIERIVNVRTKETDTVRYCDLCDCKVVLS